MLTLGEMVKELTEPTRQQVRRADGSIEWVVSAPSLLDQLSSLETSSGEGARRAFGSRPTANLEALDLAGAIDRDASALVRRMGEDDDGDTKAMVRKLHALTASVDGFWRSEIEHYVRTWYCSARVLSGWDSPSFKPANHCPCCEEYGTLRVHVGDRLATCVSCRATWDSSTLGILAAHIRSENGEDTPSAVA